MCYQLYVPKFPNYDLTKCYNHKFEVLQEQEKSVRQECHRNT
jgi:hypothetical protein